VKERVAEYIEKSRSEDVIATCGSMSNFLKDLKLNTAGAEKGDPLAQSRLAGALIDAYDDQSAYFWATLALTNPQCQPTDCQGFSKYALSRVENKVTPQQKAAIDDEVKAWKPKTITPDPR